MAEPAMKQSSAQSMTCARIPNGYRVHSAKEASKFYDVTVAEDTIICTCADYIRHKRDKNYQCRHIMFALEAFKQEQSDDHSNNDHNYEEIEEHKNSPDPHNGVSAVQPSMSKKATPHMRIKRSLSPDAKINCLSITIGFDLAEQTTSEIKAKAAYALKLQHEIASDYLLDHQAVLPQPPSSSIPSIGPEPKLVHITSLTSVPPIIQPLTPVSAKLVSIGTVNGKWGLRYFLTVDLGGKTTKLFGNQKQLSEYIQTAGYIVPAEQIRDGINLNIPCRVVTKPSNDGRYLNVEAVFPA